MQKISSYLYPNRVQLLADLAGFNVEYTNVYQRNVQIYSGIDNVIEFDIKNADQKRIDLTTLSSISMNVMDASGKALSCSPYAVVPSSVKGIAVVTIPLEDLAALDEQTLFYSVTAIKDNRPTILYADSKFGAQGKLELHKNVIPWTSRPVEVYNSFVGEIAFMGNVIYHTSAIHSKFYEAEATPALRFNIEMTGFIGSVWLEATTDSTISVDSFKYATKILSQTYTTPNSSTLIWNNVDIGQYNYFRVYYQANDPLTPTGSINRVIVNSDVCSDPYNTIDGGNSNGGDVLIINGGAA